MHGSRIRTVQLFTPRSPTAIRSGEFLIVDNMGKGAPSVVPYTAHNLTQHGRCIVHGSLARAGKVKSQTPKVEIQEKKKTPRGRAKKRMLYNRRFVNVTTLPGGKRRMNPNPEK
ncbi:ribosomal protein S30-domain-containing protein [Butyriboletus roseoflavus]|nr:ribosomal protein S30-domain-containing protein [Butyriboletus roseoflavus]